MRIDIKPKAADRLHENEVSDLFTSQDTYAKIMNRETVFITGPKGTGKSMILRYMSMPIQSERQKSKKQISYDKKHCGVYINCSKHYFGQIHEPNSDIQQTLIWKENFIHMFNLTICHTLFENIENSKKYPVFQMAESEEAAACKKISIILDCEEVYSFEDISNKVRKKMMYLYSNFDKKETGTTTVISFISELEEILRNKISMFKNKSLCILLDNYNELTDIQREIINDIISLRTIFKIATLPPNFSTMRESGKFLSFMNDFDIVNIGTTNLSRKSPNFNATKCFLKEVANKRLKEYNVNIEILLSADNLEIFKHKTSYVGFENFVLLSSGNARMFLRLLNIAIQKWSDTGKSIPQSIQQQAAYGLAYDLMRKDTNFLSKPHRSIIRSFILKVGLLFQNYHKITKKYYLQLGIKDPEKISDDTRDLLSLATEHNYIMQSPVDRTSREGYKLESITLLNALLPYFDLALRTHQVREISAKQLNNLINKDSTVKNLKIILGKKTIDLKPNNMLSSYMNDEKNSVVNHSKSRNVITKEVQQIVNHISDNQLGVFIGSGISKEIGYPTGSDLAEKIALHFEGDYVGEDLTAVVNRVLTQCEKGDLVQFIKNLFKNITEEKSTSYTKLAELQLDEMFTTNWDHAIKNTFKKLHKDIEVVVRDEHIPLIGNHKPIIYKLHGDFDHPDLFAITEDDYNDIENTRSGIINALKVILMRKHFLFLGYSMEDLDLLKIIGMIKKLQGEVPLTSYVAISDVSEEKKKNFEKMGIILIPIKGETLINSIHKEITRKR
ncbi:MAG: SIR2 family protein [Cenarchaeum symbiont of Oopsacas minuta]|nr:SIR2 family protein [Cenarchaeum symbiont of Oopsacas minuta]